MQRGGMQGIQQAHMQLTNNQMLQQVVSGQLLGAAQGVATGFLNKLGLQPMQTGPNASQQKVCFVWCFWFSSWRLLLLFFVYTQIILIVFICHYFRVPLNSLCERNHPTSLVFPSLLYLVKLPAHPLLLHLNKNQQEKRRLLYVRFVMAI